MVVYRREGDQYRVSTKVEGGTVSSRVSTKVEGGEVSSRVSTKFESEGGSEGFQRS